MRVLVFGDSITFGYNDAAGGWAQKLRLTPVFEETDHSIYPLGISGDTTEGVLKRFEIETLARRWHGEKTFTVLAIGTNDAQYLINEKRNRYTTDEFEHNYRSLLDLALEMSAGVLVLGLPPVDDEASKVVSEEKAFFQRRTVELNEIIKQFATEKNIPFVDIMSLFQNHGGNVLLDDGLHPNTQGHELIYREVCKQLRDLLHI